MPARCERRASCVKVVHHLEGRHFQPAAYSSGLIERELQSKPDRRKYQGVAVQTQVMTLPLSVCGRESLAFMFTKCRASLLLVHVQRSNSGARNKDTCLVERRHNHVGAARETVEERVNSLTARHVHSGRMMCFRWQAFPRICATLELLSFCLRPCRVR